MIEKYLESIIDSNMKDSAIIVQEIGAVNAENYAMKQFIINVVGFDPTKELKIKWSELSQQQDFIDRINFTLDDGAYAFVFYKCALKLLREKLNAESFEDALSAYLKDVEGQKEVNGKILSQTFKLLSDIAYNHMSQDQRKNATEKMSDYIINKASQSQTTKT